MYELGSGISSACAVWKWNNKNKQNEKFTLGQLKHLFQLLSRKSQRDFSLAKLFSFRGEVPVFTWFKPWMLVLDIGAPFDLSVVNPKPNLFSYLPISLLNLKP